MEDPSVRAESAPSLDDGKRRINESAPSDSPPSKKGLAQATLMP